MGDWRPLIEIGELLATVAVLLTLQWAAVERARAHREWARVRQAAERRVVDWHVVLGVAVGCV
jgi:hypothetical protein